LYDELEILLDKGILDVNKKGRGDKATLMEIATLSNDSRMMEKLLKMGAKANGKWLIRAISTTLLDEAAIVLIRAGIWVKIHNHPFRTEYLSYFKERMIAKGLTEEEVDRAFVVIS